MKEFNINSFVKIKLTEEGTNILREEHNQMAEYLKNKPLSLKALGEFQMPVVDENGYTQMELCQVMQIFGKYMYSGNPNQPFETVIAFDERDLIDTETKGRNL